MPSDVRIPTLGESVTEGVIVRWIKNDGDAVQEDEPLLELETDKASVEIPADISGVLRVLRKEGETVQVGDVVARIEAGQSSKGPTAPAGKPQEAKAQEPKPAASVAPSDDTPLSPAVRKLVEENQLDPQTISGTGRGGRLTKADVVAHLEKEPAAPSSPAAAPAPPAPAPSAPAPSAPPAASPPPAPRVAPPATVTRPTAGEAESERVPMTRLRLRIAERLVQAQHTAAILTTFNEVDMTAVMALRSQHKDRFKETHGVPLGFMSFFARACIRAFADVPAINAQIDGTDVVYHRHAHLGVAVSTERGLVVPVLHYADRMSFAQIESEIMRVAGLARLNKLSIDDLSGGTFSISNGGTFGSLMSTPILNPPQSAILGMHKIQKRPVVVDDQIVIRPMMYLALSYDHRLIDGEHAVTFLVRVKERLEDPARLLLEI